MTTPHDIIAARLRRAAERGDRKGFELTRDFNGYPKDEADRIWEDAMNSTRVPLPSAVSSLKE